MVNNTYNGNGHDAVQTKIKDLRRLIQGTKAHALESLFEGDLKAASHLALDISDRQLEVAKLELQHLQSVVHSRKSIHAKISEAWDWDGVHSFPAHPFASDTKVLEAARQVITRGEEIA